MTNEKQDKKATFGFVFAMLSEMSSLFMFLVVPRLQLSNLAAAIIFEVLFICIVLFGGLSLMLIYFSVQKEKHKQ